jgi:hypothetical protein
MSSRRYSNVAELVEKYTNRYPTLDRDLIRKLIRIENPHLFSEEKNASYLSNLRKLDRKLKKAFESKTRLETLYEKLFEISPEELRMIMQEVSRQKFQQQKEDDKKQVRQNISKS